MSILGKSYRKDIYSKNNRISQIQRTIVQTERDIFLLGEMCESLYDQLQAQEDVNKAAIQRYEQVSINNLKSPFKIVKGVRDRFRSLHGQLQVLEDVR